MSSYITEADSEGAPLFAASKHLTDGVSQVVGFENPEIDVLTVRALPVKSIRHPNGVEASELVQGILNDLG
jgi:hypothetical protein